MRITSAKWSLSCFDLRLFICTVVSVCILWCLPSLSSAQQPTATITSFSGTVHVSIQGNESVVATVGRILNRGDTIQTQTGANVVLTLSDGSELRIGEETNLDVAVLSQQSTGARVSRLKLAWGRMRAFLSPRHQKEGSSFDVETPNAVVGVKFSEPDIEVIYDPETRSTIVRAYTVAVSVTNLVTKEVRLVPKGHQAIVQDEFLWIAPITTPGIDEIPPEEKQRQTRIRILLQSRQIMGGIVSSVPASAGGRAETSQSPGLGTFSEKPRPRPLAIRTSED
jgi:hypothetical protein